jgi:glycosyltransferase involved in cell wall biosynthesis
MKIGTLFWKLKTIILKRSFQALFLSTDITAFIFSIGNTFYGKNLFLKTKTFDRTLRMNIAIDCRPLQNRYAERGIGTVVRNLLSYLVKSRCSSSLILCGNALQPPIRCGKYVMLKRPLSHDWLSEQLRWPFDLRAIKAGIFHSTVSLGLIREIGFPLVCGVKSIATIHDLNPLRVPSLQSHVKMKSYMLQRMAVRRADRVITVSQFVKKDVMERLRIPERKVRVVPNAVDETIAAAFDRFSPASALPQDPFILTLGEDEHKNVGTAVAVFERLADLGFSGTLRVVGALERQTDAVKRAVRSSRMRERIVFTGSLTPEHLVANYALCKLFLFPSRLEGFGLPVIEAMYCGAPVICSNTTALPETGGDAALYYDPDDINGMVHAAGRLLEDEAYRGDRIGRGADHARRRSWKEATETVLGIYEELGAVFGKKK